MATTAAITSLVGSPLARFFGTLDENSRRYFGFETIAERISRRERTAPQKIAIQNV